MLVMPVPKPDSGASLQGVSGVEGPAEDPVGGGAEGNWDVGGPVEDPGPPGRREVHPGDAGLPYFYGCWKESTGRGGGGSERGV